MIKNFGNFINETYSKNGLDRLDYSSYKKLRLQFEGNKIDRPTLLVFGYDSTDPTMNEINEDMWVHYLQLRYKSSYKIVSAENLEPSDDIDSLFSNDKPVFINSLHRCRRDVLKKLMQNILLHKNCICFCEYSFYEENEDLFDERFNVKYQVY